MKPQQSSRSAEGVALIRAIESAKPEPQRIIYDPYARRFLPTISYTLIKLLFDSGLYERMAPGATGFVAVRERYIDDYLKASLAEGLDQVVILGAGFDTRAYRIAGIEKTRVFEIDHPATQAEKLKRLKKIIDPLPDHVTFIPVDFTTQTLSDSLKGSAYSERAKTLFIWQGVTYFLTQEAVDSTLAFIAQYSGPGSAVIFDYFYNETLRDTTHGYGKSLRRAQRLSGEAYMFGIDEGQIESFLTRRGFCDVRNITMEDLKARYFAGPNARRKVPTGIAIASASVCEATS
jgi:methyltransferase (TIGR00027 family)